MDCNTENFEFHSDHRLINCKLKINKLRLFKKPGKSSINILVKDNNFDYINEINKNLQLADSLSDITTAIKNASNVLIEKSENLKKEKVLPDDITLLIKRREKLKLHLRNKKVKIEFSIICKLIKNRIKQFKNDNKNKIIERILNDNKSTKKIKKQLSIGKHWINYMVDTNGNKIFDRKKINKLATEYYTKIYNTDSVTTPNVLKIEEEDQIPNFIYEELENVVESLKNNKSTGHDKICNEQIKYGGDLLRHKLLANFNQILQSQQIPLDWKKSEIILIFKKGDRHQIENYRPITISSTLAKIFSKLLVTRLNPILNFQQPREQAGFRKSFCTIDHLHTINQIIEKGLEYQIEVHLAFIDFSKAFDSINHDYLFSALKNQGLSMKLINLIKNLYTDLETRIITDQTGDYFKINRGVKQGDPLSPLLFNCLLEEIFKNLNWENRGININGEYLNNLRFADDVIIITTNPFELTNLIRELNEAAKKAGLSININKTKILSTNPNLEINIDNSKIEIVDEVVYLGQLISLKNKTEKEVNRRISLAWKKYWSLKHILKGPFSYYQKSQIFNSCIIPVISYGSQSWAMTNKEINRLNVTQNSMERSMLGIKLKDKINLKIIKNKFKFNNNIIRVIKRLKWKWAGHISRMKDNRWTYRSTFWFLAQNKRKKGKQKKRWRDDIGNFIKYNLFHRIAIDRVEWDRLQEAYAHF